MKVGTVVKFVPAAVLGPAREDTYGVILGEGVIDQWWLVYSFKDNKQTYWAKQCTVRL